MKVGSLVSYSSPETGKQTLGYITDALEDNTGNFMYEVICTHPYERFWFSDLELKVISE